MTRKSFFRTNVPSSFVLSDSVRVVVLPAPPPPRPPPPPPPPSPPEPPDPVNQVFWRARTSGNLDPIPLRSPVTEWHEAQRVANCVAPAFASPTSRFN